MSTRRSERTKSARLHRHPEWHKSYRVNVDVNVAKILAVIALFAVVVVGAAKPREDQVILANALNVIWQLVTVEYRGSRGPG